MKWLLSFALAVTPFATLSAQDSSWVLERSRTQTVTAPDGHAYELSIAWPEGRPPVRGWPVLWVLDGEDNFAIAALTARRLARAGARTGIEDGLIVAIDSGPIDRRIFDYTPAVEGYEIPPGKPAHGYRTGGSSAFLAFLRDEIAPVVEGNWSVDSSRHTLLGHSFAALPGLQAIVQGGPWSRLALVSPSLWFGDGKLAGPARAGGPVEDIMILQGDEDIAASQEFAPAFAQWLDTSGITHRTIELPGQGHGTTMLAGMGHAIAFAFGSDPAGLVPTTELAIEKDGQE